MSASARCCRGLQAWAGVGLLFLSAASVSSAQVRGSLTALRSGLPDQHIVSYVSNCLGGTPPRPVQLYARGGWFVTDDLRQQMREHGGNVEGVALVWKQGTRPRAVYQWNHDDEFERNVVACLDPQGKVMRAQSQYTPGNSEPDQHWIYIHTLAADTRHRGQPSILRGGGRFTDAQGHPMGRPHLTTEDQDFIAGERVYQRWEDFDFATLVNSQQ